MPRALLGCLLGLLAPLSATGSDPPVPLEIGWLAFGDLYHVPSHHLPAGDGAAGLVVRRGYLTFDARFGQDWFGRLRFETNQSGEFETYSFEVDPKDVHAGRELGRHRLLLGLAPTLTFDRVESAWGLRYLARTPMDLQGAPSRDTGVRLSGPLNASGTLAYRAMFSPKLKFGADSRESLKWMAALEWSPLAGWLVDLYADHERVDGPHDRSTWQVFLGRTGEGYRWGAMYSDQDRERDPPLRLWSAYLVREWRPNRSLVLRVDRLLEPSPRGDDIAYLPMDPAARATLFIGGLEFRLGDHFRLTPNTVVIRYDRNDAGVRPATDLHLRLTAFFDFE